MLVLGCHVLAESCSRAGDSVACQQIMRRRNRSPSRIRLCRAVGQVTKGGDGDRVRAISKYYAKAVGHDEDDVEADEGKEGDDGGQSSCSPFPPPESLSFLSPIDIRSL